jgi:lipopolysaccharide transport system ATP-binding protein
LHVDVEYWNLAPGARLHVCLHVINEQQIVAFTTSSNETDAATRDRPLDVGLWRSVCQIPGHLLNSGVHRIVVLILVNGLKIVLRQDDCLMFDVVEQEQRAGAWYGKEPGAVRPLLNWRSTYVSALDARADLEPSDDRQWSERSPVKAR